MTPAVALLKRQKQQFRLHSYDHEPGTASYGMEAAEKLGLVPMEVFKTLLVETEGGELLVAVLPVCTSLNLKKLAAAAGVKKISLAEPGKVERVTGYVLGGVSPLGQKKLLRTFIDDSARERCSVYVSAGRRGLDIELAPDTLRELLRAQWVSLTAV